MVINLTADVGFGGHAQGDTYISVEYGFGSQFNDIIVGDAGNNYLVGFGGDDAVNGKDGNDRVRGHTGDDTLIGGSGADLFDFDRGDDQDIVDDFEDNIDSIDLRSFGFSTSAEALGMASQVGSDTVFDFGSGDTLTVLNSYGCPVHR